MFIPLSVLSLGPTPPPQPNTFPHCIYIERRQAEIALIVSLSAKFQMNWPIDQMCRLTRWPFIVLAPNKGGSVEEINLYQRFELLYIERK